MKQAVGVLGAGGFGRALALSAARAERDVVLWSRGGGEPIGDRIKRTKELADLRHAEVIFVAVPSQHVAELAGELGEHLDGGHFLVHVSRGLVGAELQPLTQVLRDVTPCRRVGALAGPLVADALAEGVPAGGVVASLFPEVIEATREAIAGPVLRIYSTDDVQGVEVASAMVGLLALITGFALEHRLSPATLAVMCTRGMVEAGRLGRAFGAQERTFGGLAGLGDLLAALAGDDRPEIRLGRALAAGKSLEAAGREAGAYIEGVTIAQRVTDYAARKGFEMPISQAVAEVLDGRLSPQQAIEQLMTRRLRTE